MNKFVVAIITVVVLSSLLAGATFASYRGYGLASSDNQTSARTGSIGGIWLIGGALAAVVSRHTIPFDESLALSDETRRLLTHLWHEQEEVRKTASSRLIEENRTDAIPQLVAWMDRDDIVWEHNYGAGYTDEETIAVIVWPVLHNIGTCEDVAPHMLARIAAAPHKHSGIERGIMRRCDHLPDMSPLVTSYRHHVLINQREANYLRDFILERDADAELVNDALVQRIRTQLNLGTPMNPDAVEILLENGSPDDVATVVRHYQLCRPPTKPDYTRNIYLNKLLKLIEQYGTPEDVERAQQNGVIHRFKQFTYGLGAIGQIIFFIGIILMLPVIGIGALFKRALKRTT